MMMTQKERQIISLLETVNIQGALTNVGIHTSLVKHLGLPVLTLNTTVKNCHVIEENGNQCGIYQIFFEEVNTSLNLCKNFHRV
jgi:hypothetical protein